MLMKNNCHTLSNEEESPVMSKEDIREGIRESLKELRASLHGEHCFLTEDEFWEQFYEKDKRK